MDRKKFSIKELFEFIQDDELDVELKLTILKFIISMKEDSSIFVPDLISFIERNNYPEILSFAIEALGEIGLASEAAVPVIGEILDDYKKHDSYDYIQNYAANALGKIGSIKAVPFLITALESPDSQGPCLAAIHSLSKLKSKAKAAVPILEALRKKTDYKDYFPAIDMALQNINSMNGAGS